MQEFDLIIAGAGPAGLFAAQKTASAKMKVLVLDRKQEIGPPKRCAEGLGLGWFKRLGLKPQKEWAVQAIYGATLYAPSGKAVSMKAKKIAGYVLERKAFEKHLAIEAAKKGAKIIVKANVESMQRKNAKVEVTVKEFDERKTYTAALIIAADGVDSRAARMLGKNTANKPFDMDSGFQYEMTNLKGYDEQNLHMFFGTKIAPRGYLWCFPKRKNTANVGIGIAATEEKSAKHYLDEFIKSKPEIFKDSSIIEVNAGAIPVGGFLEDMTADNLLVCGDAAHMTDPIHGGGIGIAMEGGQIAAEIAIKAHKAGNYSHEFLQQFNKEWYARRGNQLKKRLKARHFLEKLTDDDFNYLAESITVEDCLKIAGGEMAGKEKLKFLGKKILSRQGLAKIMAKYATS